MANTAEMAERTSTGSNGGSTGAPASITLLQRIGLGAGGIPDLGMQYAIMGMASPIFNVAFGVSPVLIGVAMSLPRIMELIIDPWIGGLSDRTRGRWGRRHPYIFTGGIAGGLIFSCVWWVPLGWSVQAKGYWLILLALLHFAAYSFYMVPYSALLSEVSTDPVMRTRVMAMRSIFATLCGLAMSWIYWLCQQRFFSDMVHGMRWVGIGFGLIMACAAVVPTLVCKENRHAHVQALEAKPENEWRIIWELLRIREFQGVLLAVLCLVLSFVLVQTLGFYISNYYMFEGRTKDAAVLGGIGGITGTIAGLIAAPTIGACTQRWGIWRTLSVFMVIEFIGVSTTWWTSRPEWPYVSLVNGVSCTVGLSAFWIIMPSLTGEITNRYEQKTGKSLYGSFSALYSVSIKIASSTALLLTGFVLNITGYVSNHGLHQAPYVFTRMRILNVLIPSCGVILAMMCLSLCTRRAIRDADQSTLAGAK